VEAIHRELTRDRTEPGWDASPTRRDGVVNETDRELIPATDLVRRAHEHGLLIHTWTFRNEQFRLLSSYKGNPLNEYLLFFGLGVDGVFSDFPDTGVDSRELFRLEKGGTLNQSGGSSARLGRPPAGCRRQRST
jgi:glycerophosphoryl diester phosphodiesterase